jgi:hypothetical protein
MNILFASLAFLILTSCGKSTSTSNRKEVNQLCGYSFTSQCVLPAQYVIVSKKRLPEKIKVYFKNREVRRLAFDKCLPNATFQSFPILGVSMIGFRERIEMFQEGMSIEIVDAGKNCDNDAIFFDQEIIPVKSDSWENTKITMTFNLDN